MYRLDSGCVGGKRRREPDSSESRRRSDIARRMKHWETDYQVLMPPSIESKLVCGLKTDIPLAASFKRDDCSGFASVIDFRPEKICSDED